MPGERVCLVNTCGQKSSKMISVKVKAAAMSYISNIHQEDGQKSFVCLSSGTNSHRHPGQRKSGRSSEVPPTHGKETENQVRWKVKVARRGRKSIACAAPDLVEYTTGGEELSGCAREMRWMTVAEVRRCKADTPAKQTNKIEGRGLSGWMTWRIEHKTHLEQSIEFVCALVAE